MAARDEFWQGKRQEAEGLVTVMDLGGLADIGKMRAAKACMGAATRVERYAFLFVLVGLEDEAKRAFRIAGELAVAAIENGDRWVYGSRSFATFAASSILASADRALGRPSYGSSRNQALEALKASLGADAKRVGRAKVEGNAELSGRLALCCAAAGAWTEISRSEVGEGKGSQEWRGVRRCLASAAQARLGKAEAERVRSEWRGSFGGWLSWEASPSGINAGFEYAEMATLLDVGTEALGGPRSYFDVVRLMRYPEELPW